jgi:hypothetical protein
MAPDSVPYPSPNPGILADAHVHIYPCYNIKTFLESAQKNFQAAATQCGSPQSWSGVLFLTETRQENYFQKFAQSQSSENPNPELIPGWKIQKTQETCSLYAQSNHSHQGIYLIAGQQIVTAENLEVLALATIEKIPERLPLEVTLQEVINQKGIPVIPWGFGKWFGRRGKLLHHLLNQPQCPPLFLGDNSGRPQFWSSPPLFQQAQHQGIRILPGTDPLPFTKESSRAGKYGFALTGELDTTQPAASLQQLLKKADTPIQPYGTLETPWRFLQNQIAMQLIKHHRQKS